jgi:hypothetical protein
MEQQELGEKKYHTLAELLGLAHIKDQSGLG